MTTTLTNGVVFRNYRAVLFCSRIINLGVGHELNRKCNAFNTAPKKIDVSNEAGCFWSFLFCFFFCLLCF